MIALLDKLTKSVVTEGKVFRHTGEEHERPTTAKDLKLISNKYPSRFQLIEIKENKVEKAEEVIKEAVESLAPKKEMSLDEFKDLYDNDFKKAKDDANKYLESIGEPVIDGRGSWPMVYEVLKNQ